MIIDLDGGRLPAALLEREPRPVVVVGAGPAGLALTLALADRGRRVVLLEAGGRLAPADLPEQVAAGPAADSADATGGRPYRFEAARRQGVGGTGEAWHGQCMRLHADDLAAREWLSAAAWPIAAAELDRWYAEAERFFEVTGRGYGADRWADHPRLSPPAWAPELLRHDFTEYAPQHRVGTRFADRLATDPLVDVVLHAVVAGVQISPDAAVGAVLVRDSRGREHRIEGGDGLQVVLAAGAIENARTLQLSDPEGIGLGTGRWHTGRWLQDHPVVRLAEVVATDGAVQDLFTGLHQGRVHLFPKVRLAPEVQRAEGLLDATAIFAHDLAPSAVDAIGRLRGGSTDRAADLAAVARGAAPLARAVWRRRVRGLSSGLPTEHVWLDVWLEQRPSSDSRVVLSGDIDPLGLRRARVEWQVGELELRTSRRLADILGGELERLGLAEVRRLPAATDDAAWYAGVTDAFHPAGTTRMATDPADGVVDADLAVHGVDGLSVVGGSVFPTSGYANPTLTIVALALRLADRLAAVPAPVG